MKKDDYKTEFEEQRQEIDLVDKNAYSRADFHSKNKKLKKGSRFSLVNILLIIFTLIPIGIFAFVIISLNISKEPITPKEDNGIQFETSGKPSKEEVALADKEEQEKKEQEQEQAKAKEQAEAAAAAAAEEERKAEEARLAEEERQRLATEEADRLAEQQRQEEVARKEQEQAAKKEEGTKEQAGGKTHTVGPGETLYRISVNYYQTGDGVDKIKSANGLSSNSISEGQKLVIP